ncbi:MAG: DEAD/DEAH box helicase [Pseudomonadota bacterium]
MKTALADALAARGYDNLTPVQEAVTDPDLTGADLLVSAQTGSGKTLAFGLAIAPTLLGEAEAFETAAAPLALVIAPTRELAMQVRRELGWLYEKAGAQLASTVGGMDMRDERRALTRGAHLVVATPGRLRDHIMRGSIDLTAIRAVVLDEADEMLDLGFREDLEFILGTCPEARQTLLFSATVPAAIAKLAQQFQKDAKRIAAGSAKEAHADIAYRALEVSARDVENAIINVLRFHEAPNAIVFANTRATVNRLTTRLSNRGFAVVALSGELTQSERTHALQAMRDGRAKVCVATDVAARGIDLPNLDLVVHAELPTGSDTLLHRSGRTGRAGRKGTSVLIVPPSQKRKAHRLLGWAKLSAEWGPAPSADAVRAKDRDRMLEDPAWHEDVTESESPLVNDLAARFSPEQLAAAYLRLRALRETPPEDLSETVDAPEPRKAFGPGQWFAIAGGRGAGHDPRRLLPMLCKAGGLTKDDIGPIRIREDESFVQIAEASVPGFQAALGKGMQIEGQDVRLADGPPPGGKPRPGGGPKGKAAPSKPRKPHHARPDGVVDEIKPAEKKPRWKKTGKPKGPKPPMGKPSSKKNRARASKGE